MATLNVRRLGPGDRPKVLSMVQRCVNLSPEEKDCAVELMDIYLSKPGQDDYSFIAAEDSTGSPAGYVCYGKRPLTEAVYDLYWVVVDPDSRRQGVGRRLVECAEELLRKDGARIIIAETSGLPQYGPARALYERCGFVEEARIRGFYKPGDDLVVYVKRV